MGPSLKIDVGAVLAGSRRRLTVDEDVTIPEFGAFTFPEPAHVLFELHEVDRGLHIEGTIDVAAQSSCDRCLKNVTVPVHAEVEERLELGGKRDPLDLNNVLEGDDLDVADLARQLITSALPMGVLCDEACGGVWEGEGDDGKS
jgi:uncharacterized metal-binding protein YceD (DUF177 family)